MLSSTKIVVNYSEGSGGEGSGGLDTATVAGHCSILHRLTPRWKRTYPLSPQLAPHELRTICFDFYIGNISFYCTFKIEREMKKRGNYLPSISNHNQVPCRHTHNLQ